jgi:hypothetical protein
MGIFELTCLLVPIDPSVCVVTVETQRQYREGTSIYIDTGGILVTRAG